jgi:hypothetical protein
MVIMLLLALTKALTTLPLHVFNVQGRMHNIVHALAKGGSDTGAGTEDQTNSYSVVGMML